jgi:hypothetical protein
VDAGSREEKRVKTRIWSFGSDSIRTEALEQDPEKHARASVKFHDFWRCIFPAAASRFSRKPEGF